MKLTTFAALLFLMACSSPRQLRDEYSSLSFMQAVDILAQIEILGGRMEGLRGGEGEFYALFYPIQRRIDQQKLDSLLESSIPSVRAMGLLVLAMSTDRSKLSQFSSDTAKVKILRLGCFMDHLALSELAQELVKNPFYFGHGPDEFPYGVEISSR